MGMLPSVGWLLLKMEFGCSLKAEDVSERTVVWQIYHYLSFFLLFIQIKKNIEEKSCKA